MPGVYYNYLLMCARFYYTIVLSFLLPSYCTIILLSIVLSLFPDTLKNIREFQNKASSHFSLPFYYTIILLSIVLRNKISLSYYTIVLSFFITLLLYNLPLIFHCIIIILLYNHPLIFYYTIILLSIVLSNKSISRILPKILGNFHCSQQ